MPAEARCQANRGINAVGFSKLTKYCDSFRFLKLFCVYFRWEGAPFVIGRKNWLFCNSPGGATASARLYSIIETAKANNLKIYDYLVWLFENIHILPKTELLPWSSKIPPNIRKG